MAKHRDIQIVLVLVIGFFLAASPLDGIGR